MDRDCGNEQGVERAPPDIAARATSLEGELARAVDRGMLLSQILIALGDRLATLEQRPGDILQAWRAASPRR